MQLGQCLPFHFSDHQAMVCVLHMTFKLSLLKERLKGMGSVPSHMVLFGFSISLS